MMKKQFALQDKSVEHIPSGEGGLYDPSFEHDACGIGFVANIKGNKSHQHVDDALTILENMEHRGACGCEVNTGDGAGIFGTQPARPAADCDRCVPRMGRLAVCSWHRGPARGCARADSCGGA